LSARNFFAHFGFPFDFLSLMEALMRVPAGMQGQAAASALSITI
jgi:hypothetical protein